MAKTMKSFRLDEDTLFQIEEVAYSLGMTNTQVIELAIDWLWQSDLVPALKSKERSQGKFSRKKVINDAVKDSEISCTVRTKIWQA